MVPPTRDPYDESLDPLAAAIAATQEGVISRTQMLDLGFGEDAIDYRIHRHRLTKIYAGVYAWGHDALTPAGRRWAAVLAGGEHAALGGRSAGSVFNFCAPPSQHFELAVPPDRIIRREGIRARRLDLPPDELTDLDGLPIVIPMRAFLDAAIRMNDGTFKRMTAAAERVRLFDARWLAELCERHPNHRARRKVRALLESAAHTPVLREEAEWKFYELLERYDLPRPSHNVWIPELNREADTAYVRARVMIEIDGYETHGTRTAFEDDRARDLDLAIANWLVVRVTWRAMHDDSAALAARIRQLLATRGTVQ
jgi:hypothetical protein